MKQYKYNEMMVHVPLSTHKEPKDVLVISNNASDLITQIQKHTDVSCDVISENIDFLREIQENKYDVVICEYSFDPVIVAHIHRVLKEDGLFVMNHIDLDNKQESTNMLEILGKYAKIIMPYFLDRAQTALFASKEYHPTADIILQRADLLDGLEYYNSDLHVASFAMGNDVRKTYLGIIKN